MDKVLTCSFRKAGSYYSMPDLHSHSRECELYFLSTGERRYFIQDRVLTVRAKGFVYIKAGLLHRTSSLGGGSHTRYYANVSLDWISELAGILPPFFVVQNLDEAELMFAHLLAEADNIDELSETRCRALVSEILVCAYRAYRNAETKSDDFLDIITAYIRSNLKGDLSLGRLAGEMQLSPTYFSALFHRRSGMRVSDFIRLTRLNAACDCLRAGAGVREAAEAAGFSDPGYFKDVFRKVMKISPSAWKKAHR